MADQDSTTKAATKPKPTAKPRAVTRKTKAEREEYARQEAERAKERAVKEPVSTPKPATRGRGGARGGRGRGGAVTQAAGVFGAGSGLRAERSRGPIDLGQAEALDGSSRPIDTAPSLDAGDTSTRGGGTGSGSGGRGGAASGSTRRKEQAVQYFEDDDVDEAPRRDIERIWISSDEEDEVVSHKGKERRLSRSKVFSGLRPVRATRTVEEEFEDETKEAIKPRIGRNQKDHAVIEVESDEMQVDEPSASLVKPDPPSSPELTKKKLRKSDRASSHSKARNSFTNETIEEKAERLRLRDDVHRIRTAFLKDMDGESKEEEVLGPAHDRMFLFQLPPLVPQLRDPSQVPQPNGDPQIKAEEAEPTTLDAASTAFTAESGVEQRFPAGLVGQLRVHKSGKVSLDWGGTNMEVRYGTEVDFLQDVIRLEGPEPRLEDDENATRTEKEGQAYALGQVRRKMVLIPDWTKLYS